MPIETKPFSKIFFNANFQALKPNPFPCLEIKIPKLQVFFSFFLYPIRVPIFFSLYLFDKETKKKKFFFFLFYF